MGIIAAGNGTRVDVQIAARSAPGHDYTQPEVPVTGPEHPPLDGAAPAGLASSERYLAALATAYAANQITSPSLHSQRGRPGAIPYGATITFHSGAAVFMHVTNSASGTARTGPGA